MITNAVEKTVMAVITGVAVTAIIGSFTWIVWVSKASSISMDSQSRYILLETKIDAIGTDVIVIREQSTAVKENVDEIKLIIRGQ